MNIAFHYYAVKAIAQSAGINPKEAQLIAEYSQFVDDFNWEKTFITDWASTEAKDIGFAKRSGSKFEVTTVKTGFWSARDYVRIADDWKMRNRLVIPFHFIPSAKLTENTPPKDTVTREARDGDFIEAVTAEAFHKALTTASDTPENERKRWSELINLGMLLHVFADTYAHQQFSGQWNSELNNYKIAKAVRVCPTKEADVTKEVDVTTDYTGATTLGRPAIGHGTVGTAPDETYINFEMVHMGTSKRYARSNIKCFLEASKRIYDAFAFYTKPTDGFRNIEEKLRKAFLIDNSEDDKNKKISSQWEKIFHDIKRGIKFDYNRETVFKRLIRFESLADVSESDSEPPSGEPPNDIKIVTDEFFEFMVHAYKYRARAVDAAIR